MSEDSRGWQNLELKPEVWNEKRQESIQGGSLVLECSKSLVDLSKFSKLIIYSNFVIIHIN